MGRVTLKDVAARAGVSYQTVSKVLNNQANVSPETEERIWQAVQELGYRPNISARNLRTQSSNLIGYAWRQTVGNVQRPILDQFVYNAAFMVEAQGYHLLTFLVDGNDDKLDVRPYRELYAQRQVEGFILADTNYNDPRIAYLMEQNVPFASFGRANEAWDFCWVDVDGRYGIRLVVDHLVEQGHRRIALLSWPQGSMVGEHREQGYLDGLHAAGIELDPEWISRGSNTVQMGSRETTRLLSLPADRRPTAVVCVSDQIAVGAMNAAAAAGLQVGRDIAVTGYDDAPMAEFLHPPLTSVRQPIPEVGQQVVDLLLRQIEGETIAQKGILLKPELIIRKSG